MDLMKIWGEILYLFLEMAPYLMIGLIFVGILHILFSKELVIRHIGSDNISSVTKASLFGIPLPLCSCGVIPTSVFMTRNGASKAAVVSFLTSTPQTGIDSMIATYGMMGWVFAIFRPVAALIMGIAGGLATLLFEKSEVRKKKYIELGMLNPKKEVDACGLDSADEKPKTFKDKFKKMSNYAFVEFLDDISVQFLIGLIISGLIAYFIPDDFFSNTTVNSGIVGMLIMIAIGAPMYVCSTASIPIALTLMMKGFSPGTAFVFLAVGPATNAASFSILIKVLGKKISLIYILSIVITSIAFGYLLDFIFEAFAIEQSHIHAHIHSHGETMNDSLKIALGLIFFILLAASYYRKIKSKFFKNPNTELPDNTQKLFIEGMTCNHCVNNVEKAIKTIIGVESVDVSLSNKSAVVTGKFDINEVRNQIESVGYKVK